ncbi:unnamed protein product, partial [Rotaria magnacalcarata]
PPKRGGGVAGGKQRNQNLDKQINQIHQQLIKMVIHKLEDHHWLDNPPTQNPANQNSPLPPHYRGSQDQQALIYSFNRLLNEFTIIRAANGQQAAKIFVPRSIQRIKDTDMVALIKRVDLEIPDNRITEALTKVGLDAVNVTRLNRKEGNIPISTIKITFKDANNRNTFIHIGLQVDSMHVNAEAASQNKKSVQCYICHQYNHVAKYCKTKQQICAKCCDNHRIEQCTAANDAIKCNNCKGKYLATANDCPNVLEQEKRMLNLINQYSSTSSATTTTPLLHDSNEFPSLPNMYQRQQDLLHNDILDELINLLTIETLINDDATSSSSFSDSDEDVQIVDTKDKKQPTTTTTKPKKQIKKPTTAPAATTAKPTTSTNTTLIQSSITTNDNIKKPTPKPKAKARTSKRNRSLDSSLESTIMDPKDRKTDTIND